MALLVKVLALVGVSLNFIGSMMLLRDFRDIAQIPFFAWQAARLRRKALAFVKMQGGTDKVQVQSLLTRALANQRKGTRQTFSFWAMLKAQPARRDVMQLVNDHNTLRENLHLGGYHITEGDGLNADAVQDSFSEITAALLKWKADPDPESHQPRGRALKFFIIGFALLVMASLIDLIAYLFT